MNKTMCRSNIFITSLVLILSFSCALCYAQQQSQQQQPAAKQQASARLPSPFPQVLSLEPKVLFQGDEKTLAINGKNFDEKMVFDFGRGIQAKFLKVSRSRTSATVRVLVDKAAKKGKRKVYLTLSGKKTKVADITIEEVVPRMIERDIEQAGTTGARIQVTPPAMETQQVPLETGPIVVVSPSGGTQVPGYAMAMAWLYNIAGDPPSSFDITLIRLTDRRETPVTIERYNWNAETRRCDAIWNIPPNFYFEGEYKLRVSAGEESDESNPFHISYHRILSPVARDVFYTTNRAVVSWFNTGTLRYNNPLSFNVSLINLSGEEVWNVPVINVASRGVQWLVGGRPHIAGLFWEGAWLGASYPEDPYRMRVTRRTGDGRIISVDSGIFEIRYPTMSFVDMVNSRDPVAGSNTFYRDEPVEIEWTGHNFGEGITAGIMIEAIFPGGRREFFHNVGINVSARGGHLTWLPSSGITSDMARLRGSAECRVIIRINGWNNLVYRSRPFYVSPNTGRR